MEKIYVFDVDGTLTKPRQPITPEFNQYFLEFARRNLVYLITGSDFPKLKEQLPDETIDACYGVFTCSGSELRAGERLIYRKEHKFPDPLIAALEHVVDGSAYKTRCGNHIEPRAGMLNVSVVGRNATMRERRDYHEWDKVEGEREEIIRTIESNFLGYEASAGGEISVDIVPLGWSKAVAKTEIEARHRDCHITFFGDRMDNGGNDKPLADVLREDERHMAVSVSSYLSTWALMQMVLAAKAA